MFELHSNLEVQRYCEAPATHPDQVRAYIASLREQYRANGIGRWLVSLKSTGEALGWAGLKVERNVNGRASFVDLGYRILPAYWNKGYMTEAARALVQYGFERVGCERICGYVVKGHEASAKVLQKAGLRFVEDFWYTDEEQDEWYEITKEQYFTAKM
uniref:N-acetyltransferase domain-containing protein n=1 Tax=Arcella intermedia TaxID=1963864 RepID=A0A6B2LL66_9EUKA